MFRSIQSKTMFFLLAFSICLIILVAYLMVFGVEFATKDLKSQDLKDKAVTIAKFVEKNNRYPANSENIKSLLDDMKASNAFIIDKDGAVIGNSDREKPYKLNFPESSSVQTTYKNKTSYLSAIARIGEKGNSFVIVEEEEKEAFRTLNHVKTIIIIITIAILFLLWPIGKKMSYRIQTPIKELADAANQIAKGDISQGIDTTEEGELASIAQSFNKMLDNLKSTMQQVLDKSGEAASMQEIMEYIEGTYDNLPGGIISINTLGEITTFNTAAEELTGMSAKELIGIDIKNPTPPGLRNLIDPLRRCLSRGSLQLKTLTDITTNGGQVIPLVYSINIHFGINNEVLGAICVFRRIEDIKRFEESANRAKNMESLGKMAASLAHEIKNPLTSIRGYTQYLKSTLEEKHYEELDIVLYEVDRLTSMLDSFLHFARPKLPEMKQEDLGQLMEYVVTLVKGDIPSNIDIRTILEETPKVNVDKEMFEPLILNLILNAIQALPNGGEIILRTFYDKKRNVVCGVIHDNGVGIAQDISDKIFDPFFTTKSSGTGMGLATASRTVEAHKGVIEVESIVGEMTKFTIILQAASENEKYKGNV